MGFSLPNPISFSDILAYVNLKGVMDGDVDYFIRLIQAMDHAYLTALKDKAEEKSKGNKEGNRRG